MTKIRIAWSASSNITFRGETEWDDFASPEDAQAYIDSDEGWKEIFNAAIEASGFECYGEVVE